MSQITKDHPAGMVLFIYRYTHVLLSFIHLSTT